MKRYFLAFITLAIVGCSGPDTAKALSESDRPLAVQVVAAKESNMPVTVPILGTITAESRSNIGCESDGRVIGLLVHEGDRVVAGQPLIQLAPDDAQTRLSAAKGGLQQAILSAQADEQISDAKLLQARLDFSRTQDRLTSDVSLAQSKLDEAQAHYNELKRGPRPQEIESANSDVLAAQLVVESDQTTADFSQLILKRKSALLKEGGISQNEVDQATLDYDHAVQSVQFSQQELRTKQLFLNLLKEGTPKEELAAGAAQLAGAKESLRAAKANMASLDDARQTVVMAQADHDRAVARLQQVKAGNASDEGAKVELAQQDLQRTQIRTPISGVVASIKVVKGQVAKSGQIVAEVTGQGGLRMEATAMDQDITQITKGQHVNVSLRSNPGRIYNGIVEDVLPPGAEGHSSRIIVSLQDVLGLTAGDVVNGEVTTNTTQKVITIPSSAITSEIDSEADVYVVRNGVVRQIPVQLGPKSGNDVSVVSGLAADDRIALTPKNLHDDQKVDAQEASR